MAIEESGYIVYACAILTEHVHVVMARHERKIERMIGHLKTRATQQLIAAQLWPGPDRPVWAEGCWKVFIDELDHLRKAIAYVESNPAKEGRPPQVWPFVAPPIYV